MRIKHIIEKYGFPLVSKGQSRYIYQAKHTHSVKLLNIRLHGGEKGIGKISERWKFLIEAPFEVIKLQDKLTIPLLIFPDTGR